MKRKALSVVLAASMLASVVTPIMVSAEESKVVKFAFQGDEVTWQQEIIDKFEAETGYTVEVILIPSDQDQYTKTMLLMESEDTCPDVIAEDGFMVKSDAAAGKLYALDEALADWDGLANYDSAILEGGKGEDGNLYGLMCSTDTQILYYNKELFAEIGIEGEWQPTSWEEIIDVANQLKEANGDVEDFIPLWLWGSSTYPEETSMRTFQLFLAATEGNWPEQLYNSEEGKWVVDHDSLLTMFNFVDNVFNVERICETPAQSADSSMSEILVADYMKNGMVGMSINGSWTLGTYAENSQYPWAEAMDVWGCAEIPNLQGDGYVTISGGWTWAVPELSTNKEGGVELLKYLCSYDGILSRVIWNGETSPRTDVAQADEYVNQTPSAIPFTARQLSYAVFRPAVDGYSSITASLTSAIESIVIGAAAPEEAITTLQEEMIRQFGEENVIVK